MVFEQFIFSSSKGVHLFICFLNNAIIYGRILMEFSVNVDNDKGTEFISITKLSVLLSIHETSELGSIKYYK